MSHHFGDSDPSSPDHSEEDAPRPRDGKKRCLICGTVDTPLWRLGPDERRSLCNACGIRWRRTRGDAKEFYATPAPDSAKRARKKKKKAKVEGSDDSEDDDSLLDLDLKEPKSPSQLGDESSILDKTSGDSASGAAASASAKNSTGKRGRKRKRSEMEVNSLFEALPFVDTPSTKRHRSTSASQTLAIPPSGGEAKGNAENDDLSSLKNEPPVRQARIASLQSPYQQAREPREPKEPKEPREGAVQMARKAQRQKNQRAPTSLDGFALDLVHLVYPSWSAHEDDPDGLFSLDAPSDPSTPAPVLEPPILQLVIKQLRTLFAEQRRSDNLLRLIAEKMGFSLSVLQHLQDDINSTSIDQMNSRLLSSPLTKRFRHSRDASLYYPTEDNDDDDDEPDPEREDEEEDYDTEDEIDVVDELLSSKELSKDTIDGLLSTDPKPKGLLASVIRQETQRLSSNPVPTSGSRTTKIQSAGSFSEKEKETEKEAGSKAPRSLPPEDFFLASNQLKRSLKLAALRRASPRVPVRHRNVVYSDPSETLSSSFSLISALPTELDRNMAALRHLFFPTPSPSSSSAPAASSVLPQSTPVSVSKPFSKT